MAPERRSGRGERQRGDHQRRLVSDTLINVPGIDHAAAVPALSLPGVLLSLLLLTGFGTAGLSRRRARGAA